LELSVLRWGKAISAKGTTSNKQLVIDELDKGTEFCKAVFTDLKNQRIMQVSYEKM
jgi:hypothetical protein